ncbi:MAG: hypothetical protein JW855_05310 [Gammaproteobacteria bacterium]|nr:hypothetical protein [Gammaproteobacteria bacterium]
MSYSINIKIEDLIKKLQDNISYLYQDHIDLNKIPFPSLIRAVKEIGEGMSYIFDKNYNNHNQIANDFIKTIHTNMDYCRFIKGNTPCYWVVWQSSQGEIEEGEILYTSWFKNFMYNMIQTRNFFEHLYIGYLIYLNRGDDYALLSSELVKFCEDIKQPLEKFNEILEEVKQDLLSKKSTLSLISKQKIPGYNLNFDEIVKDRFNSDIFYYLFKIWEKIKTLYLQQIKNEDKTLGLATLIGETSNILRYIQNNEGFRSVFSELLAKKRYNRAINIYSSEYYQNKEGIWREIQAETVKTLKDITEIRNNLAHSFHKIDPKMIYEQAKFHIELSEFIDNSFLDELSGAIDPRTLVPGINMKPVELLEFAKLERNNIIEDLDAEKKEIYNNIGTWVSSRENINDVQRKFLYHDYVYENFIRGEQYLHLSKEEDFKKYPKIQEIKNQIKELFEYISSAQNPYHKINKLRKECNECCEKMEQVIFDIENRRKIISPSCYDNKIRRIMDRYNELNETILSIKKLHEDLKCFYEEFCKKNVKLSKNLNIIKTNCEHFKKSIHSILPYIEWNVGKEERELPRELLDKWVKLIIEMPNYNKVRGDLENRRSKDFQKSLQYLPSQTFFGVKKGKFFKAQIEDRHKRYQQKNNRVPSDESAQNLSEGKRLESLAAMRTL